MSGDELKNFFRFISEKSDHIIFTTVLTNRIRTKSRSCMYSNQHLPLVRCLGSREIVVWCKVATACDGSATYLTASVFRSRGTDTVRRRSGRSTCVGSGPTCKQIPFRIRDTFHPFGPNVALCEFQDSRRGKTFSRNGDISDFHRDGRDELSGAAAANAPFCILCHNSPPGNGIIDLCSKF